MKRLSIKLIFLILPVLAFMAALNVWVDSGDLFGGRYEKTAEIIASGRNAGVKIVPSNWGSLQVAIVNRNLARGGCKPKDILVFGSSRSSEISGDLFEKQTFFNCAVPGGNILDYVALYGLYKKNNLLPRYLFISIDPWTFYKRSDVTVQGETYHVADTAAPLQAKEGMEDYLRLGLKEIGATLKGRDLPAAPSHDPRKYLELLSPAYFQASLRSLLSYPFRQVFVTDKEVGAFYIVIRKDGSYSLKEETRVDCQKVKNQCGKFVEVHKGRFFVFEKTDRSYLAYLYRFLDALSRDGVVPVVYFSPMNPVVYDQLTRYERNSLEGAIKGYCRGHGVATLGSFDPHLCGVGGSGSSFLDEYHPVRSVVRRTFQQHREELSRLGIAVLAEDRYLRYAAVADHARPAAPLSQPPAGKKTAPRRFIPLPLPRVCIPR